MVQQQQYLNQKKLNYIGLVNKLQHFLGDQNEFYDYRIKNIVFAHWVVLDAAVTVAATEDPAQYGSHFFKLFKLAYDLECANTVNFNNLARKALHFGHLLFSSSYMQHHTFYSTNILFYHPFHHLISTHLLFYLNDIVRFFRFHRCLPG